jgi:uncharacterized cupredoxin-like copper-binding protein
MTRKFISGIVLLTIAVLGLVACGSNSPQDVTISLTDFGIEASQTTFKVGQPYHFIITNDGAIEHELMIMPPMAQDANMEMSEMDEMALAMVEEDDLPPGATETLDVTFDQAYPAGTLEFSCHVEGHYENGMKEAIIVEP